MGAVFPAQISSTAFPFELLIVKESVGGLAGLSPTVALRDGANPTSYLDWADGVFKTVGWTLQNKPLADRANGTYGFLFDLTSITPALVSGQALVAEYSVNNGAGILGMDVDVLLTLSVDQDLALLRKLAANRLEEQAGNPGALILYDDDAVTPLKSWTLRDASGGAVLSTVGAPARRGPAT